MGNLKKELLKDIEYLEKSGEKLEYKNDLQKIFATSEFTFKTSQALKDIISIIGIDKSLIKDIPVSIRRKYLKNYEKWIQDIEKDLQ